MKNTHFKIIFKILTFLIQKRIFWCTYLVGKKYPISIRVNPTEIFRRYRSNQAHRRKVREQYISPAVISYSYIVKIHISYTNYILNVYRIHVCMANGTNNYPKSMIL